MPFRPAPRDLTAAILVLVAALIWTAWGSRELRRAKRPDAPPPAAVLPAPPPAPAVASLPAAAPPAAAAPDEARRLRAAVREALKTAPLDPAPLARLEGDALLEFAVPPHSKEVRLESFRLLSERGYSEGQLRRVSQLFDAEPDEDVQVSILLGATKTSSPAADALARKALTDPKEALRAVATASLDAEKELDRRMLIGLATADPSEQVRGSAALQLTERSSDPAALDAILSVALKDASDENRKLGVGCLKKEAHRGEGRVLDALRWSAERDRSAEVRTQARLVLDSLPKGK